MKLIKLITILLLLFILWGLYAYLTVSWSAHKQIKTMAQLQHHRVAVVFGAGVYPNGRLSPMLTDRVLTAVALYKGGKVDKLLMTGDNSIATYNEPWHMADFAISQGVPEQDIAFDYAGRRTYASCWRARHIFNLEDVVLVTQHFHLPRALYLCRSTGLNAAGVEADRRDYKLANTRYTLREIPARIKAWLDVHLLHPPVIGGDPINIFSPTYRGRYQ